MCVSSAVVGLALFLSVELLLNWTIHLNQGGPRRHYPQSYRPWEVLAVLVLRRLLQVLPRAYSRVSLRSVRHWLSFVLVVDADPLVSYSVVLGLMPIGIGQVSNCAHQDH